MKVKMKEKRKKNVHILFGLICSIFSFVNDVGFPIELKLAYGKSSRSLLIGNL